METKEQNVLLEQLTKHQQGYITDSYAMSIGEFMSMYKDGELTLKPEYQREFRWSNEQQSRFIESVFLQIPLPSIFIFQDKKKWEVIDGLQRLSTIFRFTGILKDTIEKEELNLEGLKTIPALNGMSWADFEEDEYNDLKFMFRKTKIDVKIIKNVSDKNTNAKFELFQRINQKPSILSGQEYRNALFIMYDQEIFNWLVDLSQYSKFKECITGLSDKWIKEQYDKELVLRLFIFANYELKSIKKIDDFLDNAIFYNDDNLLQRIREGIFVLENEKLKFQKTFDLLYEAKGEDVFRKESAKTGQQFLESYYEAIAVGLYFNVEAYTMEDEDIELIRTKIALLEQEVLEQASPKAGSNTEARIKKLTSYSKKHFIKQDNG